MPLVLLAFRRARRFSQQRFLSKQTDYVSIGNVRRPRGPKSPDRPELLVQTQPELQHPHHMLWMLQKDALNQDMLLVGHSTTTLRRLALQFAAVLRRTVRLVSLTADTCEADLLQRRELVFEEGLQLEFSHSAAVDAAIHGRILVLDGLHRASRNVLPALHNLLEHRQVTLEDGRILGGDIPVHDDFLVVATTNPQQALDPPLRSRFACRRVDAVADGNDDWLARLQATLQAQEKNGIEDTTSTRFLLDHFPEQSRRSTVHMVCRDVDKVWNELKLPDDRGSDYKLEKLERTSESTAEATFATKSSTSWLEGTSEAKIGIPVAPKELSLPNDIAKKRNIYLSDRFEIALTQMFQSHSAGRDVLVRSPPGQGKSVLAQLFGQSLGYRSQLVHAHTDMTNLFVRRTTDHQGATEWVPTVLLRAMQSGDLCVLDHADKLRPDVLGSLRSLCENRDVFLPDGRRAMLHTDLSPSDGLVRIHPSFRLILLASSPIQQTDMFNTVELADPTETDLTLLLRTLAQGQVSDEQMETLLRFRGLLSAEVAADCGVLPLSTRNMIRIVRRLHLLRSLHDAICEVLVADLLPPTQKQSLNTLLLKAEIAPTSSSNTSMPATIDLQDTIAAVGNMKFPRLQAKRADLVPSPNFFDIPSHVSTIQDLLADWYSGERSFLLLGNQGVGKNMVIDRFCQVLNSEREYIQLHRDSTIGQITIQPSLENGKIVWKDSPLIRAARDGLTLVIDEADKAPSEVLSVLKGLVEDGELLLADDRRISRHEEGDGVIQMHKNFSLWVLANRPGFPFHGNEFFTQIGDCFSTRVVQNPDLASELKLLEAYAPDVRSELIQRIASCFADLRKLSDNGEVSYPYSTREAVAVVKHLQAFPDDTPEAGLRNVLDIDSFQPEIFAKLGSIFQAHGFDLNQVHPLQSQYSTGSSLKIEFSEQDGEGMSSSPPPLGAPKEGKWDENNDPHVGGNQWAGGTGGSDTAGLGGRGGPYRLDRGHKIHQVSEEAKAAVSEEARRTARAIAEKELKKRLNEINMSEKEWDMYKRFKNPIANDIHTLRSTLRDVDIQNKEEGWLRRQSHGELDDARLVDGITGEKLIYKRRGILDQNVSNLKPTAVQFVMDISGSMYRFNGYDSRLLRCLEATYLVMESFKDNSKFEYSIVGHSGDSPSIPLVDFHEPPKSEKEQMKVLQTMIAHSQFCMAGDHTLGALEAAIGQVNDELANNERIGSGLVIAVSDANLHRYGIRPKQLGKVMEISEGGVKSHCIFIASFGDEADEIKRELPAGRGHVCMSTQDLPMIIRNILISHSTT